MKNSKFSRFRKLLASLAIGLVLSACGENSSGEAVTEPTEVTSESSETETTISETKTEEQEETFFEQPADFTCYTYDSAGQELHSFWNVRDGKYYLFVPSTQVLEELTVYYHGEITGVTAGNMDLKAGTIAGAFTDSGDTIEVKMADGTDIAIVVMQSELPSVQLYLNDTNLETVHQDKDKKHKNNTIVIKDPNGEHNLTVEDSVEMKGRGNSTWRLYDKKGYQIKFDEKTSILGMEKAKKWVLLANASDDSMIRTQLVYRMASQLDMDFVPTFEYVDFWVDGDYLGTYIIGEKVEIGGSRLDLQEAEGALFEHDENFYIEEDYWFYSESLERHFVLKEIMEEEDEIIASAMEDFEASVDELAEYLYTTPPKSVSLKDLEEMIDVESFAKYYLINDYVQNREAFATSFYWYKDGEEDVIHLGPIWDFDTCMGNDGTAFTEYYGENHQVFAYLMRIPEFRNYTAELYEQYRDIFLSMEADIPSLKAEIDVSAEMNYLRWNTLGTNNPKDENITFCDTFDEAVDAVETWLAGRAENYRIMDIDTDVSDDFRTMIVQYAPEESFTAVQYAVWDLESESPTIEWYPAELVDGIWIADVDLSRHNAAGMYQIDVYVDQETEARAYGYEYVKEAVESYYKMNVELSEDAAFMNITLEDLEPCENVSFAVWSEKDAQDDIQWFQAERNAEGIWESIIDMTLYKDIGEYFVHAFENVNGEMNKLNATSIYIEESDN